MTSMFILANCYYNFNKVKSVFDCPNPLIEFINLLNAWILYSQLLDRSHCVGTILPDLVFVVGNELVSLLYFHFFLLFDVIQLCL